MKKRFILIYNIMYNIYIMHICYNIANLIKSVFGSVTHHKKHIYYIDFIKS